ncbi:MAG: DUF5674 family protein [Patescibacteria group bacterium]
MEDKNYNEPVDIKIIKKSISIQKIIEMASKQFGDVIKAVVDVQQEIMAIGGELHADEEILLVEQEKSKREHVWGINIYPSKKGDERIEFDSMINIKPQYDNRSRGVENTEIQKKIKAIVDKLVKDET